MNFESLVYRIFTVLFIIIGTVTNIISAIVYSKKKLRKTSYSTYLFSLSIADLCVTLTGNIRLAFMYYDSSSFIDSHYLNNYNGIDIRELSIASCRAHIFFTYYFTQLSSAMLCFVNLDRLFGVVVSKTFERRTAKLLVIIAMIVLFIVNIHFLLFMGDFEQDSSLEVNSSNISYIKKIDNSEKKNQEYAQVKRCRDKYASHYHYFWNFYFYIDTTIYCILPFLIMITCNFLIIGEIVKSRIRSNKVIVKKVRNSTRTRIMENKSNVMLGTEKRLSFTLISISMSFLVFTMPVFLIENLESYQVVDFNSVFWLNWKALAYMLMYLNHVFNFFFYCLLGPKFRNEVKKLIPCFVKSEKTIIYPLRFSKRNTFVSSGNNEAL